VEEFEATRRCASVFAIDLSLSHGHALEPGARQEDGAGAHPADPFEVPRDFCAVVGFGETAQELRIEDIPA